MDAYDHFYRENKDRLFAYLLRMTGSYPLAFDLVQESFVRCLSRYGRNGNNRALLYTIARNAALDATRKHHEASLSGGEEIVSTEDPERQIIEKQAYGRILDAIAKLNPDERELIALLANESFTYRQIGKLLRISEANVKVRVHRARLRLRAILAKGGR